MAGGGGSVMGGSMASGSEASVSRKLLSAADSDKMVKVKCFKSGCKTPHYFVSTDFVQKLEAEGKKVTCRSCIEKNRQYVDHKCAKCDNYFLTVFQESQLRKRMTDEGKQYWRPACCKDCYHGR
jgi:hypothetical protein